MVRQIGITAGSLVAGGIAVTLACNIWVIRSTQDRVYSEPEQIPTGRVGLLLGTSAYLTSGEPNPWFTNRISAASELYIGGNINKLIVSGANPDSSYNEPRKMYQALRKAGVPDAAITLDFAGFRTLDSVIRANQVFGESQLVVISQRFHGYRALFIADYYNIDAISYAAQDVALKTGWRVSIREWFARVRAVLDLHLFSTKPKFLGAAEPTDQVHENS